MIPFQWRFKNPEAPQVLVLGAHCDDIPIGCGGTLLRLYKAYPSAEILWVVLTGADERVKEERSVVAKLLPGARVELVICQDWRDGFLPTQAIAVKEFFESLKRRLSPDLIFTHFERDRHQDHRLVSELTWNTFRHHMILEYEIPKYDGDIGSPNVFMPLSADECSEKLRTVLQGYPSQQSKHWFDEELFRGLARLRGAEAGSGVSYAEGFYARKLVLKP